jgi:hypothetical protein
MTTKAQLQKQQEILALKIQILELQEKVTELENENGDEKSTTLSINDKEGSSTTPSPISASSSTINKKNDDSKRDHRSKGEENMEKISVIRGRSSSPVMRTIVKSKDIDRLAEEKEESRKSNRRRKYIEEEVRKRSPENRRYHHTEHRTSRLSSSNDRRILPTQHRNRSPPHEGHRNVHYNPIFTVRRNSPPPPVMNITYPGLLRKNVC